MSNIQKAVELLRAGEPVAIPTETVYGLAANIESEQALRKVFSLKERPFFDPLIAHVFNEDMARCLVKEWPRSCSVLAAAFWPGPLTLVLEKNEKVSDLITAGLSSVGLRCPSHPVAREVIEKLGVPVAAPSANKFKRTSPVKREHVLDEFGDQVFVLEGGESEIGIESTVAGVFPDRIEVYRPGSITPEAIEKALRAAGIDIPARLAQSPVAPGQLKHHYMPSIPVALAWDNLSPDLEGSPLAEKNLAVWKVDESPQQAARKLYNFFRDSEKEGREGILIHLASRMKADSAWAGILNRLDKAKSAEFY